MAKEQITGIVYTGEKIDWVVVRRGRDVGSPLHSGSVCLLPEEQGESGADGEETPAAALKSALHASGKSLVVGLPLSQILLRVIVLPAVEDSELPGMVELQIDKFSPFPVDQMVLSHEVIKRSDDECIVLAAAAKRSIVDEMGQILTDAGLSSARVDASIMGWWHELNKENCLEKEGREALVRVSDKTVEMIVQNDGIPRSFSFIGENLDLSSEETATEVANEIAHALMTLEMEHGKSSQDMITVWCDDGDSPVLMSALEKVSECEVKARSLSLLSDLSVCLASRENSGRATLNLTPASWLDAEKSKGFRKRMWVSAAVAFFLWLLLVGGGMSALIFERMKLEKLQKKDELLFPEANAVRAVKRKTNRIQCYMNHTNSALESLREISRLLPPKDIDLSEFTYRKEESIAVVGESKTGQLVLEFNKNLNGSKSFAEVIPGSRHLTKQRHHRFRFEIKLPGGRE